MTGDPFVSMLMVPLATVLSSIVAGIICGMIRPALLGPLLSSVSLSGGGFLLVALAALYVALGLPEGAMQ